MSARIAIREGAIDAGAADFVVPALQGAVSEEAVRTAFRAGLDAARAGGARSVAVPALGARRDGLPIQRCAEILLDEAQRQLANAGCVEEICFVIEGEPGYRVFESVRDAVRIAEQMERLRQRP